MILFVLELSIFFSILYDCVIYDHPVIDITSLLYFVICMTIIYDVILFKSKIIKNKNKNQNQIKKEKNKRERKENKPSSLFITLIYIF